jgi:mevalonate kinase
MTKANAPGKIILFGEHAVVYGHPALAVPVTQVQATVTVSDHRATPGVTIEALDIDRTIDVATAEPHEPLSTTVRNTLAHLGLELQDVRLALAIRSSIPIASGLGSGAAVATATVRALAAHLGYALAPAQISDIVFATEEIHHGTPSGIDNTVVAFGQPVYFCRGQPIEILGVHKPFHLIIADTGAPSLTKETVASVRKSWQRDKPTYEHIFAQIGELVQQARVAIESSDASTLGTLMDHNQALLRRLDVSSSCIEKLIAAGIRAGGIGAKLSGGGRGGNVIVLARSVQAEQIKDALLQAGAKSALITKVGQYER